MSRAPASPARIATYVAVPVALLAGLITAWVISRVPVTPAPATPAPAPMLVGVAPPTVTEGTEDCAALIDALPDTLGGALERPVQSNPRAGAWGDPPVVLVCGVAEPEGLGPTSQLSGVNGVAWLIKNAIDTTAYGLPGENTLWTAVDRSVFIAVAIPGTQDNPTVISPLSTLIAQKVPAVT